MQGRKLDESEGGPVPAGACGAQLGVLIAHAAAGDTRAFEALYVATAPWLLARVRRTVGAPLAEDVLTEVYLQVWRSLGDFDPLRGDPQSWLATLARSRALDRLRHERARPGGLHWAHDVELGEGLCHDDGPQQRCERQQAAAGLRLCMQHLLSAPERLVLGLAYWRDHSHTEIAGLTGLPVGTVKTLLRRSQHKLRAHLDQNRSARSTTLPGPLAPPICDKAALPDVLP